MSFGIDWLPSLIEINVSHMSQLESYFEGIFLLEYIGKKIYYLDYPIIFYNPRDPDYSKKLFNHLVTRDNPKYGSRGMDIERAKRLLWCPAVIEHSTDPKILNFDYKEADGNIRTYLYLEPYNLDYLVILQKLNRTHEAMIVSAYFIDIEYKRRSYIEKSKKGI